MSNNNKKIQNQFIQIHVCGNCSTQLPIILGDTYDVLCRCGCIGISLYKDSFSISRALGFKHIVYLLDIINEEQYELY